MSSVTDLGEIVGKSLTDDLAGRIAIRAAKAGALGASHLLPSEEPSFGTIDVDDPRLQGDGYSTKLLASGKYTNNPELFYGPFLQLGTFLKEKGAIDSEALAVGLDFVDPLMLVTPGTAGLIGKATGGLIDGLNATGKLARLATAVREAKGAISGAELVTHLHETLTAASKIANVNAELLAAAKLGKSSAIADIVSGALKSGEVMEADKPLLAAMLRDKKAVGAVLDKTDEFLAKSLGPLPEKAFLGKGTAEQLARGQVNPFVKVTIPSANPLQWPRQLLGFESKGDRYWIPGSSSIGGGLTKAVPQEAQAALSAYNNMASSSLMRVMAGTERDQLFRDIGAEGLTSLDLEARFRATAERGGRPFSVETDVSTMPAFQAYRDRVLDRYTGIQKAADQRRVRDFDALVDETVNRASAREAQFQPAIAAAALDQGYAEQLGSMMRRIHDEFSVRSLVRDNAEPGFGLPARQALMSLAAHENAASIRQLIFQSTKEPLMREFLGEAFGPAVRDAGLWTEKGGRLVLTGTTQEIAEGSPFLADTLLRAAATDKSRGLEDLLRTQGFDPGMSYAVKQSRLLLDATGKVQVSEGVVQGLIHDYFPRVFTPSTKFFKEFGGSEGDISAAMERLFASDKDDEILKGLMEGQGVHSQLDKAGQGKLSMAEARKWTEDLARRMERSGYGTYAKDGPALLAGYMEAAHAALMVNRLLHDLPHIGGPLTFGEVAERMGAKRAAAMAGADFAKLRRVMLVDSVNDIPKEARQEFTRLDLRYRSTPASRDAEKIAAQAVAAEASGRTPYEKLTEADALAHQDLIAAKPSREIADTARRAVAEKYHGAQEIGGQIIQRKSGKVEKFKKDWFLKGRLPESLKNWKQIKASLDREVEAEIKANSPKIAAKIEARGAQAAAAEAASRRGKQLGKELWVFTPDYAHIQEALHLFGKGEGVGGWTRAYRKWNYRFKSVLLMGDIFHYNTLAFSQLLTDPASALKVLASAKGVRRAAYGAAAGAGVGLATGRDAEGVAGLSLAGALYGAAITAALGRASGASHMALNPDHLDSLWAMAKGGWTGHPDDRAIGVLAKGMKALRDNLARDVETGVVKARIHPIDKIRFISEGWERNLWEVMHNGSKHFYFDAIMRRELPKLEAKAEFQPEALKAAFNAAREAGTLPAGSTTAGKYVLARQDAMRTDLFRQIVQSTNNAFGGNRWANLLDHPEYQRKARDFLLSPDWTASRLGMTRDYLMNRGPIQRAAIGAGVGAAMDYVSAGGDPKNLNTFRSATLGAALAFSLGKWADGVQRRMMTKGDVLAKESARMSAAALLGGFTMMNMLNYAFTGHFMVDNAEGRKTQLDMGDGAFVAMGKPWVEAFEFAGVYHAERYPSPFFSRFFSKTAPIPHATLRLLTNTNDFGGPFIVAEDSPLTMAHKYWDFAVDAVAPIGLQGATRVASTVATGTYAPLQFEAGALRTLGFQTSTPKARTIMDFGAALSAAGVSPPSLGEPSNLIANSFH